MREAFGIPGQYLGRVTPRRIQRLLVVGLLVAASGPSMPADAHQQHQTVTGSLIGVGRGIGVCGFVPNVYGLTFSAAVVEGETTGTASWWRGDLSGETILSSVAFTIENIDIEVNPEDGYRIVRLEGTGAGGGVRVLGAADCGTGTRWEPMAGTWSAIIWQALPISEECTLCSYSVSVCSPLRTCEGGFAGGFVDFGDSPVRQ